MEEEVSGEQQEEAVRVFVRIRPLNKREIAEKQTIGWNFNDAAMLEDTPNGQRVYAYDHCFGPTSSNQETYDIVGKPVVLKAMEGYNGTVFTYGQTGSGKTWTMRGCESDPGMMVLCVRDILEWVKSHPEHKYTLKVAYLEVYNEEINDLLGEQGPASKNLKIVSEDAAKGAVIGNLVEEIAKTADDFMAILQRGEASRSYASTNMNAESSRSHTIYRVSIETREPNDVNDDSQPLRTSYLNLVDLAGSERQKSTKAEGKVLKEGANINKSLLALGAVINKLGEASKKQVKGAKPAFIPYRDSKLTRILKQSLGGNTMTSILCAVTPAPMHREETVSTLKFGQTCKSIKNSVKTNDGVVDDKTLIKQYRQTIEELKAQVEKLQVGESGGGGSKIDAEARAQYEAKIQALEALLISQGMSTNEISALVQTSTSSVAATAGTGFSSVESDMEIARLNERLAEQLRAVAKLELQLDSYGDLEESKQHLEEYEQHLRQELDEEQQKVEDDKAVLQSERFKLLKDRSAIDEKEGRIGLLITNLDERESKLRQLMASMKDQQELWQRSVNDLQRREDLVHDWQRNHKQREKKLEEIESLQNAKFAELKERESRILDDENRVKQSQKELVEREQRLQVGLSRIANGEIANNQKGEALQQFEASLKRKEHECDLRDREMSSRRKELESWDVLLRDKDRKISNEQKQLDEREALLRQQEEKVKAKEVENDRKALELKAAEAEALALREHFEELIEENQARAKSLAEREQEQDAKDKAQREKEDELQRMEKHLQAVQEQCREIQARESLLQRNEDAFKQKESEFYNVKVAQITARHNQELRGLDDLVKKQLKIAADFQRDLNNTRVDVAAKTTRIQEMEALLAAKTQSIEQLQEQVQKLESGHLASLSAAVSEMALGEMGDALDAASLSHAAEDARDGAGITLSRASAASFVSQSHAAPGAPALSRGTSFGASATTRSFAANAALNPNEVLTQLAFTRHLIYQVLEKHDALPDAKATARRGYSPRPPVATKSRPSLDNASVASSATSAGRDRDRDRDRERERERERRFSREREERDRERDAAAQSEETKNFVFGESPTPPPPPPPQAPLSSPAQPQAHNALYARPLHSLFNADSPPHAEPAAAAAASPAAAANAASANEALQPKQRKNAIVPSSAALLESDYAHAHRTASAAPSAGRAGGRAAILNTTAQRVAGSPSLSASPSAARSLSKVLSPAPPALGAHSRLLSPPSRAEIKSAFVSSVDKHGTPVATVDFVQGSSLRKISRSLQSSAPAPSAAPRAGSSFAQGGEGASPIQPPSILTSSTNNGRQSGKW